MRPFRRSVSGGYTRRLGGLGLALLALAGQACPAEDGTLGRRALEPVPFTQVSIRSSFWEPRLTVSAERLIPYVLARLAEGGQIDNFAIAAQRKTGEFRGEAYYDSDVYKALEAASYSLAARPDRELSRRLREIVGVIAAAQQRDGYLHTCGLLRAVPDRWCHPHLHELYCAGHLIEAGVGRFEATGDDDLLKVGIRLADHVERTFGPQSGRLRLPPEHQGIELALLRLYGQSGDDRYLKLARFFLEQRGRCDERESFGVYAQDHKPADEQTTAVGHAVRAAYMYAAMAELAARTGDSRYPPVLERIFQDLVEGKMHVSGGVGLLRRGDVHESFTEAYDLPIDEPDVDTCSAIGLIFWLHRMNLLQPDGRYADVMERILFNRLLVGVSSDGTRFFYGCPLACRGPGSFDAGPGAETDSLHCRPKWFRCVCCPTNVPRVLASVGGYIFARNGDSVFINQYIGSRTTVEVGGSRVAIDLQTDYPWDGTICVIVRTGAVASFDLVLRVPGWARGEELTGGAYRSADPPGTVGLSINGQPVTLPRLDRGYVHVRRLWQGRDIVELSLPMPVRRVHADPRIRGARGRVALMRGPILYCFEGTDHGGTLSHLTLPPAASLHPIHELSLLDGVTVIRISLPKPASKALDDRKDEMPAFQAREMLAVPFYACDNREPGPFAVWIPEASGPAEPAR